MYISYILLLNYYYSEAEYKSLETELIPTIEVHESSTQEVVAHKEDIGLS